MIDEAFVDTFIGQLQKFGRTSTQIVFSTPVETRGIDVNKDVISMDEM